MLQHEIKRRRDWKVEVGKGPSKARRLRIESRMDHEVSVAEWGLEGVTGKVLIKGLG